MSENKEIVAAILATSAGPNRELRNPEEAVRIYHECLDELTKAETEKELQRARRRAGVEPSVPDGDRTG